MKKILYAIGGVILMIVIFFVVNVVYGVLRDDKGVPAESIDSNQIVCVTFPC